MFLAFLSAKRLLLSLLWCWLAAWLAAGMLFASDLPAGAHLPAAASATLLPVVEVTGIRANLSQAQAIKRNALEIVDAIAADDINKLPDLSVTDALQRITGVQISRDRGEGGIVTIRGLTQMETTLNGREIFTASAGRNLDFNDIPAELASSIDVYKTTSAGQIEGGIGGSVDLRTHRPFDFDGARSIASIKTIQGDLVGRSKNQYALLLSRRWNVAGAGEFGALLNLARQERAWREDQSSIGNPSVRTDLQPGQVLLAPNGLTDTSSQGSRIREGGNLVLQWRPSDALELYAEGSHALLRTRQDSYQLNLLAPGNGAFAADSVVRFPASRDVQQITWLNAPVSTYGAARDTLDRTMQLALGGRWVRQALTLKTDLSYTRSHNQLDYTAMTLNGKVAMLTQELTGSAPVARVSGTRLSDLASYATAGMVYADRPFDGTLKAVRLDGEYALDSPWLASLAAGVRYASRYATDAPGQVVFSPPSVSVANTNGLVVSNPLENAVSGVSQVQGFLLGNPQQMRQADALRHALGIAQPMPTSNPLGTWYVAETTRSAYLMAHLREDLTGLAGNIGLRLVYTDEAVSGHQSWPSGDGWLPIAIQHRYTDLLPSLNLRQMLAEGLFLRMAASKTLTRPDFNQLSPSLTLNSVQLQGSAGNPALRPVRANNLDIALERYIGRSTALCLTGFIKSVDGFVTSVSRPEQHVGGWYQVSRPYNANTASVQGLEISYQQFYDFLPGWLRGLGLQASYTYVDSHTLDTTMGQKMPLQNLSRHSANIVGIFVQGPLSARVAYNWRDAFLSGVISVNGVGALPVYTQAYGWLDASISYRPHPDVTLSLEGLNLLRTRRTTSYGSESRLQSRWINDRQIATTLTVRF